MNDFHVLPPEDNSTVINFGKSLSNLIYKGFFYMQLDYVVLKMSSFL